MARVYLKNQPRLLAKLVALRERTSNSVAPAMISVAEKIVALAKSLVPVDHGDLRDSIGWTFGDAPKGSIHAVSTKATGWRITIFAGNEKAYYARFVEFGTKASAGEAPRRNRKYKSIDVMTKGKRAHAATPADPFFFPAYRAYRKQMKLEIGKAIREAVVTVTRQQ